MLTAIQDGDAIFSSAIKIASAEERDAYIAQACGDDASLRRQVQERVAEHLQARNGSDKPVHATAHGTNHPKPDLNHVEAQPVHRHEEPAQTAMSEEKERRKLSLLGTALVLLMLVAAVGGIGMAGWALRSEKEARQAKALGHPSADALLQSLAARAPH